MSVSEMPTWDGFMVPVLRVLRDGATLQARDLYQLIADDVGLTPAQRAEVLDSGQLRFRNRVGWAASSLTRAGALLRPKRGSYTVTELGRQLLTDHPGGLNEGHLKQIPAYREHVPRHVAPRWATGPNPNRATPCSIRSSRSTQGFGVCTPT